MNATTIGQAMVNHGAVLVFRIKASGERIQREIERDIHGYFTTTERISRFGRGRLLYNGQWEELAVASLLDGKKRT